MLLSPDQMNDRYARVLLRIAAGLFVMAGMVSDGPVVSRLPRRVRARILLILRPAESALRRLIFHKAQGLEVPDYVGPAPRKDGKGGKGKGTGKKRGPRKPKFRLIDPRKFLEEFYPNRRRRKDRSKPRREGQIQVRVAGFDGQPDFVIWSDPKSGPLDDDVVNAEPLCRRLMALYLALQDMPGEALRMAREIAKRKQAEPGPKAVPPLRYGYPPGYRRKPIHAVDTVLRDCDALARMRQTPPDTS